MERFELLLVISALATMALTVRLQRPLARILKTAPLPRSETAIP